MKKILLYILFLLVYCPATAQNVVQQVNGTVSSLTDHTPLIGATIRLNENKQVLVTNNQGQFRFATTNKEIVLSISYIGYKTKEVSVTNPYPLSIEIILEPLSAQLNEVVVSTGYQTLPKERATGSFTQIDNQLLNRKVSTSILDRLEDVTSGVLFNKGKSAGANLINIRGQNTIYGNANPLIVIDNFPYDGDINNINPNDVESITVLKDAAAASIWGARAGNGVIVITTKKGKYNQPPKVSFNSNLTIGDKPNVFYQPRMSSADFIDIEKMLFSQGFYTNAESGYNNPAITPVAELLIAARDGTAQANTQIDALKSKDIRNDFEKYFYQKSINQQYAFNVNGGSEFQRYYLSAGYDNNRDNLVANSFNRLTLTAGNTLSFFKKRLEVTTGIYYTESNTVTDNPGTDLIGLNTGNGVSLYPYADLADANGNPLAITHDYRVSFIQQAQKNGLLDWTYKPLEEIKIADNSSKSIDYRVNANVKYKILPSLTAEVLYQYGRTITNSRNLQGEQSYYTRDLINNYAQVDASGNLSYPVPLGGILDLGNVSAVSQSIRGQLDYSRNWAGKHGLNAIAGYELRSYHTIAAYNRMYGYDNEHATSLPVDYTGLYPQYSNTGYAPTVPYNNQMVDLTDRYISYYANAAYTYLSRYTISASGRLDRSNLFGVNTNQQGVPLYSAGLSWNVSNEQFYKVDWMPYLKLRLTYGYNGNVNKTLSAYTTAQYLTGNAINTTYAQITNPPNPELRWERVKVTNLGVDFSSKNERISGTIEGYFKRGIDLIGDIPYAPSTGITTFRGNTANTSGHGIDLIINTRNLEGRLKWYTNLLFSYVTDKVVDYSFKQSASYYTNFSDGEIYPLAGKPFYAVYSYKWAGLDPKTGDPQGYLNGAISKDYTAILAAATPDNIVYHGPARPTKFGSVRNTFSFAQLSLSANITYRLGYYFRKNGIFYSNILSGQGYYYGGYSQRWQRTGDETTTNVPSLPASIHLNRDDFYNYSDATVEKGDNVRLQDIRLSYDLTKSQLHNLPFKHLQVYLYVNNIGILWKATKSGLDPDYPTASYRPVKTIAAGLKADF